MKKSSSKKTETAIAGRPRVTSAAVARANEYQIILKAHPAGGFVGSAVEMPLVISHAKDEMACLAETRRALAEAVAHILESGRHAPAPAAEHKREVQLNIRLTADERLRIQEKARLAGIRSLSDYVRRAALRGVG